MATAKLTKVGGKITFVHPPAWSGPVQEQPMPKNEWEQPGNKIKKKKKISVVPHVEQGLRAQSIPIDTSLKGMKGIHLKKAEQAGGRMSPSSPFLVSKKVTD